MKKIKTMLLGLKSKISSTIKTLTNPKKIIAQFIYLIYRKDRNKIPYPFLAFVIDQPGWAWAGSSIYLAERQIKYLASINKLKSVLFSFVIPVIILSVLILAALQESESFLFGFTQNLLADIILIVLASYIFINLLNKPKKYNIVLLQKHKFKNSTGSEIEISLSLHNIGEDIFQKEELYWEIFIPSHTISEEKISEISDKFETNDDELFPIWKLQNTNSLPLFLDQNLQIAKLNFSDGDLPLKIYYIIRTSYGNFPKHSEITKDFRGQGIPLERYPRWGDFTIEIRK